MKSGMNLFNHFLWENFEVEWRKEIRLKAIPAGYNFTNHSVDDEIIKTYALNLHFINRFESDPGFKQYLINQIENDDETFVRLEQYIESLKEKYIGNTFDSLFSLDKYDANSIKNELDKTLEYNHENYVDYNEIKAKFLKNRLEIAEAENNCDEVIAIKSLIFKIENKLFGMYDLFQKNIPYQRKVSEAHNMLNSKGIRYIAENLSSFDVYLKGTKSTILRYLPEPEKKLISRIFRLHPSKLELTQDSIEKYAKFVLDSLKISFVLWFEKKKEDEKISILSTEYEFILDDSEINKFVEIHGMSKLSILTLRLYKSNYFFEAKTLYEYLLKNTANDAVKRANLSNCALCYREIGDYKLALQKHLQEYEILCESENERKDIFIGFHGVEPQNDSILNNLRRSKAIALKNIGENYLYLGDVKTAKENFNEAIEIVEEMSNEYKVNIYFNLACVHKRNYNYTDEHNFLLKCVDLLKKIPNNEGKKSTKEAITNRLKIHAKCFDSYSSNNDKNNCLKKLEMREKFDHANRIIDIGNRLFDTFQFSKSINYYKRANQILESDDLNFRISYCYFTLYLQNISNQDHSKRVEYLNNAKKYLAGINPKNLLKSNNKYALLLKAFTYIGDSLEMGDKKPLLIGFEGLKKHILLMYSINSKNHDDIIPSLRQCLIFSLQLKRKELVVTIFDEILNEVKKHEKLTSPHGLVGVTFIEFFIDDLASQYIDEGLNEVKNKNELIDLLDAKAHLELTVSNAKSAIKHYENALLIDANEYDLWFKISLAYSASLQYTKAKNAMQKALDIMPKNTNQYSKGQKLMVQFKKMMNKQIDLESIDEKKVKDTLISAEKELLDSDNTDYSGSLVKYSKAIQIIMDKNVSKKVYEKSISSKKKSTLNAYKNNKKNPYLFKILLNNKKSPGLGEWGFIMNDIENAPDNIISIEIKKHLFDLLNSEIMDSLKNLRQILQVDRNKGSHDDIIGIEKATTIRKKAIPHINKIINYFY